MKLGTVIAALFMAGCAAGLASCASRAAYVAVIGEHRFLPRSPKWSIEPATGAQTGTLARGVPAVYVATVKADGQRGKGYRWIWLWPDGHMAQRRMIIEREPSAGDVQRLQWADVGYFRMEGSNLHFEVFAPHYNYGNFDYYRESQGVAQGDRLVIKKYWWRGQAVPQDMPETDWEIYELSRLPALRFSPDW